MGFVQLLLLLLIRTDVDTSAATAPAISICTDVRMASDKYALSSDQGLDNRSCSFGLSSNCGTIVFVSSLIRRL